jgi:hypothetical protein
MVNAFSFCLFGETSVVYHRGLLENIDMIKTHYPGWVIYVYLGADTESGFRNYLLRDPVVRVRDTGIVGFKNTVHRFFAIDEPDVDVCFFRDADSRIHWRDRWAINGFLTTHYRAHIIRDHPEHTAMIAAGMWGLHKTALGESIRALFDAWTPIFAGNGDPSAVEGFGIDQNFLVKEVYPRIQSVAFVHFSNDQRFDWETGAAFPFQWTHDIYCGKRETPPFRETTKPRVFPPSLVKLSSS